jgi:protein-S-isoprenylcysteine O-methyltransferase Ste14
MDSDQLFHLIFVVSLLGVMAFRVSQHFVGQTRHDRLITREEGYPVGVLRLVFAVPCMVLILVYLARPDVLSWAAVPLPDGLRWAGAVLVVAGGGLLAWVHAALGRNFSGTIRIRPDHTLVTAGPYRWVRHPMYTAFCLLFAGCFLLTANWFVGLVPLALILFIMAYRTPREEAALVRTFGADYVEYQRRTGRYLPRLRRATA